MARENQVDQVFELLESYVALGKKTAEVTNGKKPCLIQLSLFEREYDFIRDVLLTQEHFEVEESVFGSLDFRYLGQGFSISHTITL